MTTPSPNVIFVPAALRDDLAAERAPSRRRGVFSDVVTVGMDVINTGGSIVAILATAASVRKLAAALVRRGREAERSVVEVVVLRNGRSVASRRVDLSSSSQPIEDIVSFLSPLIPPEQ